LKICVASLAFLPMIVLLAVTMLRASGLLPESLARPVVNGCMFFNYPAFSILTLIKTFNVSGLVLTVSAIVLMFLWASFLAWLFWKAVGALQGEIEPEAEDGLEAIDGNEGWHGFQIRFLIGFALGALVGWRFLADTKSMKTLAIASFITGIFGGLLYGLLRPPDFWSRS
ncbi:MAG: hypothetical protein ABUL66_03130, partial [Verrucomicrobiota bacterium]